jgi:prephenate dehydrogenase
MHVGFLGFGLIGGSIARAVRAAEPNPAWTLVAWSPSGAGPDRAVAEGILDAAAPTPIAALADADLVVLAGPPTACLGAVDDLAGAWRAAVPGTAVITDVASTKAALLARADAARLRYVGGHPMAGLEATGFGAARADLFVDRPWVMVPGRYAEPADIERFADLAGLCRARPLTLDAARHDAAVAGVSHLPMLLAAALVESVAGGGSDGGPDDWAIASSLTASGWRDMTRLARGDPAMGAGIAVTNTDALLRRLADLQHTLDAWRADLELAGGPDEQAIERRLRAVKTRLEDTR